MLAKCQNLYVGGNAILTISRATAIDDNDFVPYQKVNIKSLERSA